MKEAQLYTRLENQEVVCRLCAHGCRIPLGGSGFCGVRQNISGVLYTHNYAKLVVANIDPVQKKPLYHFLPGTSTFSIACPGCNFRCGFCQNWEISQFNSEHKNLGEDFSAKKVVELALQFKCPSIAYTYTEPTIYFEFALETAKLAKEAGLRNIFVTNGYMSREAISLLSPYLDAANIDLKFFKESTYQRICSAKLSPVLDSIRLLKDAGVWVEVTTLIIPGENDTPQELKAIAGFIASVNREIPWHISRFHADYQFKDYESTSEHTLKLAYDLGVGQGLDYVYVGNFGAWGQDTLCGKCHKPLIKREGFDILEFHLEQNRCVFCQAPLPGVF
ncbi:MAG: AmmeMemoRadiSam system radical SAM enzyme [Candidatus Omnitrophica bacterium CG11_big_fil_rev_8_21_14_0_20_43_6]|nr:MAG: AmmeMemoRadiSam system radical SAM enzyme [Candidatus Omnitrophica bacterium CG11_big_fil_rev_8_21_14_0_20_43_6]